MNYVAQCAITLSKKLEKLLEEGEPISIYVQPIRKNKSVAQVRFTSRANVSEEDVRNAGDTSILLSFDEVSIDAPDLDSDIQPRNE